MHYFDAVVLTILGLANGIHGVELFLNYNNGTHLRASGPRAKLEISPKLEVVPDLDQKILLGKNNEPLNMTCTAVYPHADHNDISLDYDVAWKVPSHVKENPEVVIGQGKNIAWLFFERLTDDHAGDYDCNAASDSKPLTVKVKIRLSVKSSKSKQTFCGKQWFKCLSSICIMRRYVCDGKADCEKGEDENRENCGPDPCFGRVHCEGRCIPPDWCCDHRNCSGTYGLRPWPSETHEISYVQTAFYTVIGCAMAFMFIVTILVIAICRVQIKRAMNSRWSQQNRTNCTRRRTVPIGMPIYDLDVYLNRTADNYPRGVNIMYNINSGVQFVGRPVEPPPYSEVIASPPREGPPPPYVSCENLIESQSTTMAIPSESTSHHQSEISDASTCEAVASTNDLRDDPPAFSGVVITSRSIPGPQVPTISHISSSTSGNAASRSALLFDLEYVETDALLPDNSNITITSPKETLWKSYGRAGVSNNRGESPEKRWYQRKPVKSADSSPLKSKGFSLDDAENEGVFLESDQGASVELCDEAGPSTSVLGNEQTSMSMDRKIVAEFDSSDKGVGETSNQAEASGKSNEATPELMPCPPQVSCVESSQLQMTFNDRHAQKIESSTSVSTAVSPPSDYQTEINSQISASDPVVLPLRESFIGVQKNS